MRLLFDERDLIGEGTTQSGTKGAADQRWNQDITPSCSSR